MAEFNKYVHQVAPSAEPHGPAVELYWARWCGHCTHFKPIFNELAAALPAGMEARAWEADRGAQECSDAGVAIDSFPTLFFVDTDGNRHPYSGDRSLASLQETAAMYAPPPRAPTPPAALVARVQRVHRLIRAATAVSPRRSPRKSALRKPAAPRKRRGRAASPGKRRASSPPRAVAWTN